MYAQYVVAALLCYIGVVLPFDSTTPAYASNSFYFASAVCTCTSKSFTENVLDMLNKLLSVKSEIK